jgi:hypothetical protein
MDKIKPFLDFVKKYLFWELLGIGILCMLVGWMMSTQALASKTEEQKKLIDSSFQGIREISGEMPNADWNTKFDAVTEKARKDVFEAWSSLYAMQQKEVLRWPDDLPQKEAFEKWKPGTELSNTMREEYFNFIEDHFPNMLAIVDAQDQRDAASGSGGGYRPSVQRSGSERNTMPGGTRNRTAVRETATNSETPEHDYKVIWVPESQQYIAKKMKFANMPKEDAIAQTQESIWVCEALLHIIAEVNHDATGSYDAPIQVIEALELGASASQKLQAGKAAGHIEMVVDPNAAVGGVGAPAMAVPGVAVGGDHGNPLGGPSNESVESPDARYVGDDGKPLAGAVTDQQIRRIPVYLRLRMDQTKIQKLFYACATSALPVEVEQFRLNPSGAMGGGGMMMDRRGGGGMGGGRSGPMGVIELSEGALLDAGKNPNDAAVELHGIIYMFNPPDQSKLGDMPPAAAAPPTGA